MSTPPPPPGFGPPPGQFGQGPGQFGQGPNYQLTPGAPPPSSNRGKVIAGLVAVAALSGGGVFIATRGDDSKSVTAPSAVTEETDASVPATDDTDVPRTDATTPPTEASVAPTAAPDTVAPSTDATVEATVPATDFVVPEGAVDLGYQVYLPLPAGWTLESNEGGLASVTDGNSRVEVQVLQRAPGEDPLAPMQEYVDTFDGNFAVGYSPAVLIGSSDVANEYALFYSTYTEDEDTGVGFDGSIYLFQRNDGLTAIWDVYSEADVMDLNSEEFLQFTDSYDRAPQVAEPVALQAAAPFRVTSLTPTIVLSNGLGFAVAPGFDVISNDPTHGRARYQDDVEFSIDLLGVQPNMDASLTAAAQLLGQEYTDLSFSDPQTFDGNPLGDIQLQFVTWNGNYISGGASSGYLDVVWDPNTGNAVVMTQDWFSTADGTEPVVPLRNFMYNTMIDSIRRLGVPAAS